MAEACTVGKVYNYVASVVEHRAQIIEAVALGAMGSGEATSAELAYAREFQASSSRRLATMEQRIKSAKEVFEADCGAQLPTDIAISVRDGSGALAGARVAEGIRRLTTDPAEITRLDADAAEARASYAEWEAVTGKHIQTYVDGLAAPQTSGALRPRR